MATAFTDDNDFYKMDASPKGICLIINNFEFERSRRLDTGYADRENLTRTFKKMDFEVRYFENQTRAEMITQMENIQEEDHSNYDCFVCCISSDGTKTAVCGTDGYTVNISKLQQYVCSSQCPSLAGKPKLFFVDACDGEWRGYYLTRSGAPVRGVYSTDRRDFLLSLATTPDGVAYCNPDPTKGSVYFYHLTRLLEHYAKSKTIMYVLHKLNDALMEKSLAHTLQTPEYVSTLVKELRFYCPGIFKNSDEREEELINRKIFPYLSDHLREEWPLFIAVLPGWKSTKANAVIAHKKEDEVTVTNRIFACLNAWQKECPKDVRVQSILNALESNGVNRMDLREEVVKLADDGGNAAHHQSY